MRRTPRSVMALAGPVLLALVALAPLAVPTPARAAALARSAPAAGGPSATAWPQYGGSATHRGANPFEHTFTPGNIGSLKVAWRGIYGTTATDESSPVVANGVAYIAGFDGKVSAFSTAGCGTPKCMPLWQGSTDNDITAAPAVGGGTLLVASADHFLYAFPAAGCGAPTCEPLWKGRLDGADVDSSVAVAEGLAYVGTYDRGRLDAFAISGCGAAVCDPVWAGQGGGHLVTSPAVGDGSVFIGSDDGHLYVFPAAGCGAPRCAPSWTASLHGPAFSVAPTFADHTVFMGSRTLYAFDARGCGAPTCLPLRSYDLDDAGLLGAPAVAGNLLFASTQSTPNPNTEGVVAAFPLHGCGAQLCEPLWTGINFGAGFESSPVAAGGLVFVAKGPASGFPVDAGLFAYDVHGCGSAVCDPLAFVQVGPDQFYLSSSPAVTGGQIMFGSGNNDDGTSDLYVLSLSGS